MTHELGPVVTEDGTTFTVFSEYAEGMFVCLFDESGRERRIPLERAHSGLWTAHVAGVTAGAAYGLRARGPFKPEEGHWFNEQKFLVDPYAREVRGVVDPEGPIYPRRKNGGPCGTDNAGFMPRSIVRERFSPIEGDRPSTQLRDSFIYECSVRGFTKRHPDVPPELRGTFEGVCSDAAIEHLKRLGVTAVEFLPVHAAMTEPRLSFLGLTNYWGYSPLSYFALDPRFAPSGADPIASFRRMSQKLHAHGIEVIVDIVFNHTAELDENGPVLAFRGLCNKSYYRLGHRGRYVDYTGCGNTVQTEHPQVLQLVMDSLRHGVEVLGIDGYRFDLGVSLGRVHGTFEPWAPLLTAMSQDPVLKNRKLIMEPWDLGPNGYQLGHFAGPFPEWNARFRQDVRRFYAAGAHTAAGLATALGGSSDLLAAKQSGPEGSINYIASHDGFTLHDLGTFAQKHNEANGEDNRDGLDAEGSENFGHEGETTDPGINEKRRRKVKSLLAVLALSRGVPMLAAGDEFGRTQCGNNNAYCQDNEVSWLDWERKDDDILSFAEAIFGLRRSHDVFRKDEHYTGRLADGTLDIEWLKRDGTAMQDQDWVAVPAVLAVRFPGATELLALFNGSDVDEMFTLPGAPWTVVLSTAVTGTEANASVRELLVQSRGVAVLSRTA